ncbi:transposable element Tcb2 transposase [Trichonephila clavipes]|nr:transposable element Tcb2 transposase [Trichonephila clavipes]
MSDAFLLQDDNARPHRSRIVDVYLQQKRTECMQWPARSQDLNPIEPFWNALKLRVDALNLTPRTIATLSADVDEQCRSHFLQNYKTTYFQASLYVLYFFSLDHTPY